MRTGRTLRRNPVEHHLDGDNWVEVYPRGNVRDLTIINRIPVSDRTHRNAPAKSGQSPILVRASAWSKRRAAA